MLSKKMNRDLKIYKDNNARLSGIMQSVNSGDFRPALYEISKEMSDLANKIKNNKGKNTKNIVLRNFLFASIPYVELAAEHQKDFVQIWAFCARNLFEIHLWSRYVQIDANNLKKWCVEAQKDKDDIINFIKRLTDSCGFEAEDRLLEQEKTHIQLLMKQHTIEMPKSYMHISDIAKELGKKDEYDIFFKIYSKFTHPTSFLINSLPEEKIQ